MINLRNEGPIGVFDSGLGGLTLVSALQRLLPLEDFVYLGDTARTPYGTRGKQTVVNYAHTCARALRDYRIKLLALACSTTSAAGLPQLANELFLPTLGAVYPGLEAALLAGGTRIGVLGTAYTAASSDYTEALARLAPDAQVFVQKAQLLSALLDDGSWDGELMGLAIRNSLAPLLAQQANVIVLGDCSLSVLRGQVVGELAAMSGSIVPVVDPVEPMASAIAHLVESRQMATSRTDPGKLRIVLTDLPANLSIAERFFGRSLAGISVKNVDL